MMAVVSTWWTWIVAAAILGIVEMLVPGFIALGFALGALAMAGLVALGVALPASLFMLLFAGLSLIAWIALRLLFKGPSGEVKTFDHDIND